MISGRDKISAAILAGGKSSRMNSPKGLIRIDGILMLERIASVLKDVADEILVIANDEAYCPCNYPVHKDLIREKGPAGGIHSALHHASNEKVIIVSCDVPFITSSLFKFLLTRESNADILVPVHNGRTEPLIAVYTKSVLSDLQKCIENGQTRMLDILISLQAEHIQIPDRLFPEQEFININTREDLRNAFPQSTVI